MDLSIFQVIEGLRYGFPKALSRLAAKIPRVLALRDLVAGLGHNGRIKTIRVVGFGA